jgi:hypothetical protein
MMFMVGLAVAAGVFAGWVPGGFVCAPASATPAWLAPSEVSVTERMVGDTSLAVDPKGDAVAVWWREGSHIESAFRPAESLSWSAPTSLTAPGQRAENPEVGIDARGDAVTVWQGGAEEKVEAAVRPASSGVWQAPVAISPEGGGWLMPQVAVDARGDAVAVWSSPYPEGGPGYAVNDTIQAAERPAATGEWEPAVWVSEFGKAPDKNRFSRLPQVAIDAEGKTVAVWEDQASESASVEHDVVEAAVKPPSSATWGPPVVLADEGRRPQIAMDARGDAVAVWPGAGGLYAATLPASSPTWQPAVSISTTEAEHPHVALDSRGDAVVAWESISNATNTVQAVVKPAEAAWGPPVSLSEAVEYGHGYPSLNPSVAIDAQGSAVAMWDGFRSSSDQSVQAAFLPVIGASWQASVQVADTGASFVSPLVGMDGQGNGVAAWVRLTRANSAIEAANYDGSSPILEGASIPGAGTTGQPLTFAVSPLAASVALGQTSWSFGDGSQSALGVSVTHAFTTPGAYRVTVTTADVLGNTTSASSTVLVTTAPSSGYVCGCRLTRPLALSKVRITNRRFLVTGPHTRGRVQYRSVLPVGTAFRFTLSSSATVQIEIAQAGAGLQGQRHCKKGTNRCAQMRVIGTLTYPDELQGNDAVNFQGQVGKHALRAGHYLAIVTARNGIGRSKAVRLPFVVAQ